MHLCQRCEWKWNGRKPGRPAQCPACKSPRWDVPKGGKAKRSHHKAPAKPAPAVLDGPVPVLLDHKAEAENPDPEATSAPPPPELAFTDEDYGEALWGADEDPATPEPPVKELAYVPDPVPPPDAFRRFHDAQRAADRARVEERRKPGPLKPPVRGADPLKEANRRTRLDRPEIVKEEA